MRADTDKNFVIWSFEHDAWWRPNWKGYTPHLFEAGDYSEEEAKKICHDANKHLGPEDHVNEECMTRAEAERREKEARETEESDRYDLETHPFR